jgi:DNA-binding HxlR family transcriptional regulator
MENEIKEGDFITPEKKEGVPSYLTFGKSYQAFDVNGFYCSIINDLKQKIFILFNNCGHLKDGNWIKVKSPRKNVIRKSSLEAYDKVKPKIKGQYKLILKYINRSPMTFKEIHKALFLDINCKPSYTPLEAFNLANTYSATMLSRRLPEMVRLDLIETFGNRKCMVSGNESQTYKLK